MSSRKCTIHNRTNKRGQCMDCKNLHSLKLYYKKRDIIQRYKLRYGCAHCGYKESAYALQLDHIDPSTKHPKLKIKGINRGIHGLNWVDMRIEIRKCQILCANCHAVKTHERNENE